MKKAKQSIVGDGNVQVIHNGNIITTKTVKNITEVIHDESKHITDEEAYLISKRINEIVEDLHCEKDEKAKIFMICYAHLKKTFHCTKYNLIPKGKCQEAIKELNKLFMFKLMPMLRKNNPIRYSELMRKSIYQSAQKRGLEDKIYDIAYHKLGLTKEICSLKELSPTRLHKLYTYISSIRKNK